MVTGPGPTWLTCVLSIRGMTEQGRLYVDEWRCGQRPPQSVVFTDKPVLCLCAAARRGALFAAPRDDSRITRDPVMSAG